MKIRTLVMSGTLAMSLAAALPAAAQSRDWRDNSRAYSAETPQARPWYNDRDRDDRWRDERGYRQFADIAFRNGQRDGFDKGRDDARHRRYPDVNRQKWFRNGDHDYNSRFGPREMYRNEYRRGFEEGYRRAFNDWRRY